MRFKFSTNQNVKHDGKYCAANSKEDEGRRSENRTICWEKGNIHHSKGYGNDLSKLKKRKSLDELDRLKPVK